MAAPAPQALDGDYDYVIVGGGSAGCVLANKLSADPTRRVLLLEAGGTDDWIWFHIPVGYLFAIGNPRSDWMFRTAEEAGLNGRSLAYPRGKVLGGSSAINAMINMRGQAADYDHWRQLGLTGWGWDDVLPAFKSVEDHFLGDGPAHATGGEWRIEKARVRWKVLDAVAAAAEEMGIPRSPDFNTGDNEGSGYFHVNQKRGRRWSAARGFLKPVMNRANLRVETGVLVEKVRLDGLRAAGVVFRRGNQRMFVAARREVILSAGAVATPKILHLSGIGPVSWLDRIGVPVDHMLPGVGANLQDHLQLRLMYRVRGVRTLNEVYGSLLGRVGLGLEYALLRRGPMTMAASTLGLFTRSDPAQARANIQFHVQPLSLDWFGSPLHKEPGITVSPCNLRPSSRGTIRAVSPDPSVPPEIAPNYLSTDDDRRVAADAIRLTRRLMQQPAIARFAPREFQPGPSVGESEAELVKAAGDIGTTIFHPVGTAKMGLASDPMAVVDADLRVHGMQNLRVVDASVMPTIVSGNTNTPTVMIATKGAAAILKG